MLRQAADDSSELPTLTNGVIDLVFREDDGWVIVDYKTNDLQESDIASALSYYDQQLVTYARFWEKIVQEPVVERGINFTKLQRYTAIRVP